MNVPVILSHLGAFTLGLLAIPFFGMDYTNPAHWVILSVCTMIWVSICYLGEHFVVETIR